MSPSHDPANKNGKALLIGGSLVVWFSIIILFHAYGYARTWELWRVPVESPPFSDFRLIAGSAESLRMGIEPSERNPGDPHRRKFNYPAFWRLFFYTGITQADTTWISILMIVLFFAGALLFPQNLTVPGAILMLLILFSPASMLLYERGNVDLIVFFLCVLIVVASDYSAYITGVLLMFGTVVKLFPFFGVMVLLKESKSRFAWLLAACSIVLLAYVFITWDSVRASWDLTMRGQDISYGANVLVYRYRNGNLQADSILKFGSIIVASVLVLIAGVAGMKTREWPAIISERNLAAFRMGASIYVGTFLLGNNWDYRLAFLILVVPQLLHWAGPPTHANYRKISVLTLVAVFASCWHFVVWYAPSLTGLREILFMLDELANWILLAGLSWFLGASAPTWIKDGIRFPIPGSRSRA